MRRVPAADTINSAKVAWSDRQLQALHHKLYRLSLGDSVIVSSEPDNQNWQIPLAAADVAVR